MTKDITGVMDVGTGISNSLKTLVDLARHQRITQSVKGGNEYRKNGQLCQYQRIKRFRLGAKS
jgi:hypothetical protein